MKWNNLKGKSISSVNAVNFCKERSSKKFSGLMKVLCICQIIFVTLQTALIELLQIEDKNSI